MDFIQELEDLKTYVAGLARTDMEYTCYPPKHGFAAGATIEDLIQKIDQIKISLTSIKEGQQARSAAARTLRTVVDHGDFSSDEIARLLEIANMMDNELQNSKQSFTFSSEVSINCLALAEYINSYVNSNGPRTSTFIEGLYQYLDKIYKQIEELLNENDRLKEDQLLNRLKNIFDRS